MQKNKNFSRVLNQTDGGDDKGRKLKPENKTATHLNITMKCDELIQFWEKLIEHKMICITGDKNNKIQLCNFTEHFIMPMRCLIYNGLKA